MTYFFPIEPGHEKMCLMPYANNKGADQPGVKFCVVTQKVSPYFIIVQIIFSGPLDSMSSDPIKPRLVYSFLILVSFLAFQQFF